MKGFFFTAVTFLIFLAILTYVYVFIYGNIEKSRMVADKISAHRVYYTWNDISDDVLNMIGLEITRISKRIEINDTLPAQQNIEDSLNMYQEFLVQMYSDPTIELNFEDAAGDKMNLSDMDSNNMIRLKPLNILYSYPDYDKNQIDIQVNSSNFSFIEQLNAYVKLNNTYFNCNTTHPADPDYCESWSPQQTAGTCESAPYNCLVFNLTFEDAANTVFEFQEHFFNMDASGGSTASLNVNNTTSSYSVTIQVGQLPQALTLDPNGVSIKTSTDIQLNTSDFYINLPSILNVTTVFARKVDFV